MKYEWNQRSTKYGIRVAKKPRALQVRKACKMGEDGWNVNMLQNVP